jgi:hypothetical protein
MLLAARTGETNNYVHAYAGLKPLLMPASPQFLYFTPMSAQALLVQQTLEAVTHMC